MNKFKKGYQPRTKTAEDKKGDLLADSPSTWHGQKNYTYFYQLQNVHREKDAGQSELHLSH